MDRAAELVVAAHEVEHDLLLAVHGDGAADELLEVDVEAVRAGLQVDAAVDEPLAVQALAEPVAVEHVHGGLLEHAGADAAQHVLPGAVLDEDEVDALRGQDAAEQEARGSGPHDGHRRSFHWALLRVVASTFAGPPAIRPSASAQRKSADASRRTPSVSCHFSPLERALRGREVATHLLHQRWVATFGP